jgi:glycosyltransferase involved in cell wall biosynthesis
VGARHGSARSSPPTSENSRVRVAYLTADFGVPVLGTKGASAHVRGLVQALQAEGHDVIVLTANAGDGAPASFTVREVPFAGALPALYDALQHETICQGTRLSKDLRNLLYAANLELQGRPILEDFKPDLIYERHCLFSTAGLALARYFDVPLMLEVNAPLMVEQRQMRGLALPGVALTAERLVLTSADQIVAVSEALRAYAADLGVAPDRVAILPNAADPEMFGPADRPAPIRRELGWSDRFVLGFVGSMKPWHGVETLLETLQLLGGGASRFRLLLIGAGPQLADLQEEIDRRGLGEAVHMTGAVPHHAVPDLLRAVDVAVAPYAAAASAYFSPVKLFEYMAMALPIVAARVGQVCDLIEEGRTGWLYTPGDAGGLADVIRTIADDVPLCRRIGAAARERVIEQYTWRHNARWVVAMAEDLITRRGRVGRKTAGGSAAGRQTRTPAGRRQGHQGVGRRGSPERVAAGQTAVNRRRSR